MQLPRAILAKCVACLLVLISFGSPAAASSDAGIDITVQGLQVRVLYSVALDYGKAEACIREPDCLLFDIISFLQTASSVPHAGQLALQFELYQSSKKKGNHLSLDRDPFEGGQFKELYDGRADTDLRKQILLLLERHTKGAPRRRHSSAVKLYKCSAKKCNDILFGSFPSDEMHSGYCIAQGTGCSSDFISVKREEMKRYFSEIPE